jgi:hypothetical protein
MLELLEWEENPMTSQISHGISFEPFQISLFQTGQEVQHEKLKFQYEVVPVGHVVVAFGFVKNAVDGTRSKHNLSSRFGLFVIRFTNNGLQMSPSGASLRFQKGNCGCSRRICPEVECTSKVGRTEMCSF